MKTKFERFFCAITTIGAVALSSVFSACSSVKVESGTYPLGVMLPLSDENGAVAAAASDVLRGMEIARDEINAAGGVEGFPISLVVRDMSAKDFDFPDSINAMRRSGVKVLNIGFGKQIIGRHKTIIACDDIFVNFLASYPPATIGSKNTTRIFINGAQEGDLMSNAVKRDGAEEKQLVIMNVDNFFGKANGDYVGFCASREKTKCYKDVFGMTEKNFDIFSSQIMRLWADYVFYLGYGDSLSAFVDSLARADYKKTVVANCGFANFDYKPAHSLTFFRVMTLFQNGKIKTDASENFVSKYLSRHSQKPTWMAACGFDSVKLLCAAAKANKFNPAKMREFFTDKNYDCAMGNIKFDSSADSLMQIELAEIK